MATKKTRSTGSDERVAYIPIVVRNKTGHPIWVMITCPTGEGDTSYFRIPDGGSELWHRLAYTKVTVRVKFSSDGEVVAEKDQYLNIPAWELTISESDAKPKLTARRLKPH